MMAAVNLFDAAALDVFFEDAGSMGLSNHTRLQLAHEGIADPEDFKEFNEDGLNAIFSNLYKTQNPCNRRCSDRCGEATRDSGVRGVGQIKDAAQRGYSHREFLR